ncbi:MAG TPA: LLM class flavin-dependent oxidoreductase [Dehalococcoidia bacterium]|nr:LLM class flavin-dependent oxidoreductase [Dehalococcoidia bacterium]
MGPVGLTLPRTEDIPRSEVIEFVQQAEDLGYDSIWVPEAWGRDAFTLLTQLAVQTSRIKLGTGIVNVFSRTPALLAQTVASLDEISNGRVILGLGTSGQTVIENWHGVKYDRPLQHIREYVEIIRLTVSGQRVNYDGEIFQLKNFRIAFEPIRSAIPIFVASISPKSLYQSGELADGVLPIHLSRRRLAQFLAPIADGARQAERDPAAIEVAPYIITCVSEDSTGARELVRRHIAYYVGGMGAYYNQLVARYGYGAEAARVKEAWVRGDRTGAAAAVTDELLDDVAIGGNADQARAALAAYRAGGVTLPIISFAHGATPEMVRQTLVALAPGRVPAA